MKAIVLGNGRSRLGVSLPFGAPWRTYGCNAIYRSQIVSNLIAVDIEMQHEIYTSGYCKEHTCHFVDWNPMPAQRVYEQVVDTVGMNNIIQNDHSEDHIVNIAGKGGKMYVTWLQGEDQIQAVKSNRMSSGSTALQIAASHTNPEVYMFGFDMDDTNIYTGTDCYPIDSTSLPEWYDEHELIYRMYPETTFFRVECKMKKSKADNVKYLTKEEWNEIH